MRVLLVASAMDDAAAAECHDAIERIVRDHSNRTPPGPSAVVDWRTLASRAVAARAPANVVVACGVRHACMGLAALSAAEECYESALLIAPEVRVYGHELDIGTFVATVEMTHPPLGTLRSITF